MITIKEVTGGHYVCNNCCNKGLIFVLGIHPRGDQSKNPGWWQTTWLCADCLALLGNKAVMAVCERLTRDEPSKGGTDGNPV